MWWQWPSIAKMLREAIRNDMFAKMLMKEIQNFICCMWSGPILLEDCFLKLNTHTLKKQNEIVFQDPLITFRCHCISEEKWPNNFCCRNSGPYFASLWMYWHLSYCVGIFCGPYSYILLVYKTIEVKMALSVNQVFWRTAGFPCKNCRNGRQKATLSIFSIFNEAVANLDLIWKHFQIIC
jgi:hypothetical protein